ncbi:unnamed protein product [Ambrosiozyma monospora]|uniref:Unnamed protein product n=1 Tax=Ambrosiozyma monospora TaxID=43982 RepID=A0ACB5U2F8_AMBMO|nr:unnamed protein product [Ambrosiozyma monospora]
MAIQLTEGTSATNSPTAVQGDDLNSYDDISSDLHKPSNSNNNNSNSYGDRLVSKQPGKETEPDFQKSFAKEWDAKNTGTYGKIVDKIGYCCGQLGIIPGCCCANPFKRVNQGYVGLITKYGELYKIVDPGLVRVNQLR